MEKPCSRGDLYLADLGEGVGAEQSGNRPVVVIQNDTGNRCSSTVIVAVITSRAVTAHHLPTHTYVGEECGLPQPSVILLEQLRTVDKQRLGRYIGHLNPLQLQNLDRALAASLDLSIPAAPLVLCLCSVCANSFRHAGAYILQPLHLSQAEKSLCDCCGQRFGLDFSLFKKQRGDLV